MSINESTIVKTLRTYLIQHPDVAAAFNAAFQAALATGILEQFKIATLDEYFVFYDTMLSWIPRENSTATEVYNNLCLFYFVLDLLPPQFQTPIAPGGGWVWLSQWLVDYAKELGNFMDTPGSINSTTLQTFYAAKKYHMQDYPVPPGGWKTFNDFFARHIDPAVRPIADPTNSSVIVSPADSAFDGSWAIDSNSDTSFTAKGVPWSISELLQDTVYGERFKGGRFMHAFLAPSDYHRQHAPVSGKVVEAKVIPGLCYLEVIAQPDANGKPKLGMRRRLHAPVESLDAPDDPGYQFLQARGLVVIDNPDLGLVAVLPIGMAQVSSVVLKVKLNDSVNKGDEIAHFKFGGSDIVMVFEAKANVKFPEVTNPPMHYNFGSQIATASPSSHKQ